MSMKKIGSRDGISGIVSVIGTIETHDLRSLRVPALQPRQETLGPTAMASGIRYMVVGVEESKPFASSQSRYIPLHLSVVDTGNYFMSSFTVDVTDTWDGM